MISSVKVFRLKDPKMTNDEIARALRHRVRHRPGEHPESVFYVGERWVASRKSRDALTIAIGRTDLQREARRFADEVGEL